jgi:hypothetical protein
MGGYLAGRLRTKWTDAHADEVHFRDTAHGFLAWAIASLATAMLLTSVIGTIIGGGVKAGASVAGGAATTAIAAGPGITKSSTDVGSLSYFVDSLFRVGTSNVGTSNSATNGSSGLSLTSTNLATGVADRSTVPAVAEVARIFANAGSSAVLPLEDSRYVGQLVAQRTGLAQQEADQRVIDTYARMQAKLKATEVEVRDAADKGRKASAYASLWLFVSLLVGAFVASLAATFGGRQRDI